MDETFIIYIRCIDVYVQPEWCVSVCAGELRENNQVLIIPWVFSLNFNYKWTKYLNFFLNLDAIFSYKMPLKLIKLVDCVVCVTVFILQCYILLLAPLKWRKVRHGLYSSCLFAIYICIEKTKISTSCNYIILLYGNTNKTIAILYINLVSTYINVYKFGDLHLKLTDGNFNNPMFIVRRVIKSYKKRRIVVKKKVLSVNIHSYLDNNVIDFDRLSFHSCFSSVPFYTPIPIYRNTKRWFFSFI